MGDRQPRPLRHHGEDADVHSAVPGKNVLVFLPELLVPKLKGRFES